LRRLEALAILEERTTFGEKEWTFNGTRPSTRSSLEDNDWTVGEDRLTGRCVDQES